MNFLEEVKEKVKSDKSPEADELSYYKKQVFLAYRGNPYEIDSEFRKEQDNITKDTNITRAEYYTLFRNKKSVAEGNILKKIKENSTPLEYHLLNTHAIVRGTIQRMEKKSEYIDEFHDLKITMIYVTIKIDEVITGNQLTPHDKILTIYFCPDWIETNVNWDLNKSYLFNLEFRLEPPDKPNLISIVSYIGDSGNFPIVNEALIDKTNYFGLGEKIKWNDFKDTLNRKIDSILD